MFCGGEGEGVCVYLVYVRVGLRPVVLLDIRWTTMIALHSRRNLSVQVNRTTNLILIESYPLNHKPTRKASG
jgi:hypothetical protein